MPGLYAHGIGDGDGLDAGGGGLDAQAAASEHEGVMLRGLGDPEGGSQGGLIDAHLFHPRRRGDDLADVPDAGRRLDGGRDFEGAGDRAVDLFQVGQNCFGLRHLISRFNARQHYPDQVRADGSVTIGVDEVGVDANEDLRAAFAGEGHRLTQSFADPSEFGGGRAVLQIDGDRVGVVHPTAGDHPRLDGGNDQVGASYEYGHMGQLPISLGIPRPRRHARDRWLRLSPGRARGTGFAIATVLPLARLRSGR